MPVTGDSFGTSVKDPPFRDLEGRGGWSCVPRPHSRARLPVPGSETEVSFASVLQDPDTALLRTGSGVRTPWSTSLLGVVCVPVPFGFPAPRRRRLLPSLTVGVFLAVERVSLECGPGDARPHRWRGTSKTRVLVLMVSVRVCAQVNGRVGSCVPI